MEQLQIHSKSYIVRWINVTSGHSISWSLQPHKKSLNFGIFKHPGVKNGASPALLTSATFESATGSSSVPGHEGDKKGNNGRHDGTLVKERLQNSGIICVAWTGNCEADHVSSGRYDVLDGESGMYGLVFDNTFSKQVSKTATFVLLTHPTNAAPKSGAHLHYSQNRAAGSSSSANRPSPKLDPASRSTESIPQATLPSTPRLQVPSVGHGKVAESSFYTGVMYKKRRKRNQGYARRFFSLDFTSSTLSYYQNGHSSALRGSIPLFLASVGVNDQKREFSIDSGAEVWHLRLRSRKDFDAWKDALERASSSANAGGFAVSPAISPGGGTGPDHVADHDWERVAELVARVSGSRDAVRRLAQDTNPRLSAPSYPLTRTSSASPSASPVEPNPFFQDAEEKSSERLPFWKRKPSSSRDAVSPGGLFRRSVSAQVVSTSTPPSLPTLSPLLNTSAAPKSPRPAAGFADDIHDRCLALLEDLNTTVADFSTLLASNRAIRMTPLPTSTSRMSMESTTSQDYFDAEEGMEPPTQLLRIARSSDASDDRDEFVSDDDSETSSVVDDKRQSVLVSALPVSDSASVFPIVPHQLTPKDLPFIQCRSSVPPPKQPPPSIIGFLRKNAGKDLSTVSMPVSANEPTSALQRLAEPFEHASLLTTAASEALSGAASAPERLLYVVAFAISSFSANRVKERAIRKPFNPMLGETYELVRHESTSQASPAYRFVAEKVSHHPVRMAWQADSLSGAWSIAQSPQPTQKFWGKSMELSTEEPWRLVLHSPSAAAAGNKNGDEHYTWQSPTAFLRNIIAGEKYVEPVASMTVTNETTGHAATVVFKAGGMFSGRSEDVTVTVSAPGSAHPLPLVGLTGKWTQLLTRTDNGETIWKAGTLASNADKSYGFTAYAADLNSISSIEQDHIPGSDSRLRPDQRALEHGELDRAEALKARLEERQRARRKVLEEHGRKHVPTFFEKADGLDEEVWRLKAGKDGYWECRERQEWNQVPNIFET